MELGCTVCVISGASAKTGSALSLLSLIYVIAETTRRVVENACTSKSEQEVFNREVCLFVCFVRFFVLDLSPSGKYTGRRITSSVPVCFDFFFN